MKIVIKMYKGVCFFILAMLESYEYIFRKMVMCEEKKIILKGYFMHKIRNLHFLHISFFLNTV